MANEGRDIEQAQVKAKADAGPGVADGGKNAGLEHSADGVTTRDDVLDLGVPMVPGRSDEPIGPEDALGAGPTRGDYRERIGPSGYNPHTSVPIPADEQTEGGPTVRVVAQREFANEIGDAPGKGGVSTEAARAFVEGREG